MLFAKRGDKVTLNTNQKLFFFQEGLTGITLREGSQEMAVIPEGATEYQLDQINHAIKNGHLFLGHVEKPGEAMDRDSDIKALLEFGRNKVEDWIYRLKQDKSIPSELKIIQIEKLIEFEKVGKNRKSLISRAETFLGAIGGVSSVEDTDQEKLEIKLTSGSGEDPETT